ncbi:MULTISPECIES: glutathione S-transferase family protein [unclassified Mesorhizobium]|uniref:glutathione S-transferase family protein n=1 Tax=unclassified Mesorhizobium TaxID=325217 RepID=UPI000FC9A6A9|nr:MULTISPECIES: glutathione S-transferase family protein [unclassified Mesorhizobium]RUZ91124.1 glutathione S-transferase family protein [Mesorhizobium sp. M7A.F.Ca.US.003.02.2.1]RUX75680.1 glutathione S-transferase family protein [Mesorhizobium sp. M7A.F.Ca.US.005.03.1.1]RUY05095.1 glutathione S-transferase family protein [Mesorhizobium sp. M7A.F.Ca.US.005.03.2.1]RUZ01224.1 glutathione S-transferase family protein [Mesorhizobium sp. M7A.F.Ca.CA.001.12.2.1]RUZ24066.1 glutathione S-transferase
MTILLYDLVGRDSTRPFSPHCWKVAMALAHKGLDISTVPTRFLEVPAVEGGVSKTVPVIRDGETVLADSFAIALYLDEAYPDRPTLFGGEGGEAMARFIERWSQVTIHPYVTTAAIMDLHAMQDAENAVYFRQSREQRLGKRLEEVKAAREAGLGTFRASLEPLRSMLFYQPFIGGAAPLFGDYIVFGALQWARIASPYQLLDDGDVVAQWFARCLDLHGGLGRKVAAAA